MKSPKINLPSGLMQFPACFLNILQIQTYKQHNGLMLINELQQVTTKRLYDKYYC